MITKPEIYIPKNFTIHELVPPEIFKLDYPNKYWRLLNVELLITLDLMKEYLQKYFNKKISIIVNDYFWNGQYSQSGIRTSKSKYYSLTSQHTFGNAADLKFKGCTVKEVYDIILNDPNNEAFKYITCIENIKKTPTWLHIDVRPHEKSKNGILIV